MKKLLIALMIFGFMFGIAPTVFAQLSIDLTVYPAVVEQEVTPGKQTRFLLQFRNNSSKIISGVIKSADYVISDKQGTPQLVESNQMSLKYAASKWITPLTDQISIPANDYVAVNITVDPPAQIGTCGNYAIVYFEPTGSNQGGTDQKATKSESSISAKVGALINFRVATKQCKEEMNILGFTLPKFLEYGPIPVAFDLFNKGDVHISPQGTLSLSSMWKQNSSVTDIKTQRIFPETAKSYENSIGSKWMLGRYAVALNGTFGNTKNSFQQVGYVWVLPWKVILLAVLILIILIAVGKNMLGAVTKKEQMLEQEIEVEKEEIEKLKEELKKRNE